MTDSTTATSVRGSATDIDAESADAAWEATGAGARLLHRELAAVVGEWATAEFIDFADRIPREVTRYIGAEVRLDAPDGADLLIQVAEPGALSSIPPELGAAGLDGLVAATSAAPPGLTEPLVDGWIEWDLASGSGRRPSVFAAPPFAEARGASIVPAYEALSNRPASDGIRQTAAALDRGLPNPGHVMQVGVMAPPRPAGCRVVLAGAPVRTLLDAAIAAGWPGERRRADRIAAFVEDTPSTNVVDLDLADDGLSPSIGFELPVERRNEHDELLRRIVDAGWCDPTVAAALASWRIVATPQDGTPFPARLRRTQAFLGPRVRVAVLGWLHHVKVTIPPDGPLRAKAYLGIREWVTLPRVKR